MAEGGVKLNQRHAPERNGRIMSPPCPTSSSSALRQVPVRSTTSFARSASWVGLCCPLTHAQFPWVWTLTYGYHEDRTPTHGYEPTREAAMQAFAKSWHRET